MDESVASTLETYESVAEQYRVRHTDRSTISAALDRFLDAVDGSRILDVGCGPGWESATFADCGYDPIAIDLTPAFLRMAQQTVTGRLARMDMRQLAVADGSVDGLWACASFLHVPRSDAHKTLREFHRVLGSGTLALSVKQGEGTMSGTVYDNDDRQFILYTTDELSELVVDAGFTGTDIRTENGWIQCIATT